MSIGKVLTLRVVGGLVLMMDQAELRATRVKPRETSYSSKPPFFTLRFCIYNCGSLSRPFAYARIIGESEHRSDRKLLKIFHIEPVYEAHEIFHHLLRVIIDTLFSERCPPVGAFVLSFYQSRLNMPLCCSQLTIAFLQALRVRYF